MAELTKKTPSNPDEDQSVHNVDDKKDMYHSNTPSPSTSPPRFSYDDAQVTNQPAANQNMTQFESMYYRWYMMVYDRLYTMVSLFYRFLHVYVTLA